MADIEEFKSCMALLERRRHTLLSSLSILDNWLEQNERNTEDEVRVSRIKRWRCEALEELKSNHQRIELVRQELEALEAKGFTEES